MPTLTVMPPDRDCPATTTLSSRCGAPHHPCEADHFPHKGPHVTHDTATGEPYYWSNRHTDPHVIHADDRVRIVVSGPWVMADHRSGRHDTARLDDPVDVGRFYRWNAPRGLSRRDFHDRLAAAS